MPSEDDKLRSYLKKITMELRQTRQRLEEMESRRGEPVAVVGVGCRFPGGIRGAADLWTVVSEGVDAIGDFPVDRGWDLRELFDDDGVGPGRSYSRQGGFVDDAGGFDAGFFGISPREATAMDPQQRLFLEVAWEALEDAGMNPLDLRNSNTAVFAGAIAQQYLDHHGPDGQEYDGYRGTGNTPSVLSGRVAYVLGLRGPAMSVDTACSSSLVSLSLGVDALRRGECGLALVGGATVMGSPGMFVEFSRMGGLARDGRCKSFADSADGTVWGEGAGVLVLERLSDAVAAGRRVLGVLRGVGLNQDGASNGLTAPSQRAQEDVIGLALRDAGLGFGDVDVVEAHGTGTPLGDPIEAQALLETYGSARGEGEPLRLGSLKSNLGHTQAAAGVGGVIKILEALRHESLPRTLHVDELSSHVDWSSGGVEVLRRARRWPRGRRPRRGAVSSFGISGTNAHVIVEEAPPVAAAGTVRDRVDGVVPWVISGRSPEQLRQQARRLRSFVESAEPPLDVVDTGFGLASMRARWEHRAAVVADDVDGFVRGLDMVADGRSAPGVFTGETAGGVTAFLFSGQGGQHPGMGRGLYEAHPVFTAAVDEVCDVVDGLLGRSLRDVMFTDGENLIGRTGFAQPGLFALQVGLYRLLESWGLRADVLVGHSVGELAAAHVAGVLSLADAGALVVARGKLMQNTAAGGAMTAVHTGEQRVRQALVAGVDVAAVNSETSTVISGDAADVTRVAERLNRDGVKTTGLRVSHAFHSSHMDGVLADFHEVAAGLDYRAARIPVISTVTGEPVGGDDLRSAGYWTRHIRETVRFGQAVSHLAARHPKVTAVEIGPDAALTPHTSGHGNITCVPALRRGHDDHTTVVHALAHAHTHGAGLDPHTVYPAPHPTHVRLPTTAFQHHHYWHRRTQHATATSGAGLDATGHGLLASTTTMATDGRILYTGEVSLARAAWLADHTIGTTVPLPGTAIVEMLLYVGESLGLNRIDELTIDSLPRIPERGALQLQVTVDSAAPGDGGRAVAVHTRTAGTEDGWNRHAVGRYGPGSGIGDTISDSWPPPDAEPVDLNGLYAGLSSRGYRFGPAFQCVQEAWHDAEATYAYLKAPDEPGSFHVHPTLLDSALHCRLHDLTTAESNVVAPMEWHGIELHARRPAGVRVRLRPGPDGATSVILADETGAPVVTVDGVRHRDLILDDARQDRDRVSGSLFQLEWSRTALTRPEPDTTSWTVLGADPFGLRDTVGAPDPATPRICLVCPQPSPWTSETPIDDAAQSIVTGLRTWIDDERYSAARFVAVTRGAVYARAGDDPDPVKAAAWGVLRAAQTEYPGRILLVDVDGDDVVARLPTVIEAAIADGHSQIAVRGDETLTPRLAREVVDGRPERPRATEPDDTVLITGGTGTIGSGVARHLVTAHGLRRLLLVSRQGDRAPGADELATELAAAGASVTIASCDVTDRSALAKLLDDIPAAHPLRMVIHAAGEREDRMVASLRTGTLATMMRSRAAGAVNLHELTRDTGLSRFVLFSSVAGIVGGVGNAGLAAADAFVDSLARHRRSHGLPATSIAWGPWATDDPAEDRVWGARRMAVTDALEILDTVIDRDEDSVAVNLDLPALCDPTAAETVPEVLRSLVRQPIRRAAVEVTPDSAATAVRRRLTGLDPSEQERALVDIVRTEASEILRHTAADELPPDRPFKDLGFDSMAAVELRNRLNSGTGLRLPPTVAFTYPTPEALARFLLEELALGGESAADVILADLARLRANLADLPTGSRVRTQAERQLDAMLGGWRHDPGVPSEVTAETLASVSDEDLFALIDKELGTP